MSLVLRLINITGTFIVYFLLKDSGDGCCSIYLGSSQILLEAQKLFSDPWPNEVFFLTKKSIIVCDSRIIIPVLGIVNA